MVASVAEILGWLCVVGGACGLLLRLTDPRPQLLIVLASGAWLLAVLPFVAVVLQAAARSWIGAAVAAVVAVAQVVVYAPMAIRQRAPDAGPTVRVMTQNMLLGRADAHQVVAAVERGGIDVLFLQELTAEAQDALVVAGLHGTLPHRWSAPDDSAFGAGIWSRHPLGDTRDHPAVMTATLSAVATLPGGTELSLVCVHPPAPWPRPPDRWRTDLEALQAVLHGLPDGPVVVAGDFNATLDHAPFRRVLSAGYRDAAEQAGAGLLPTWPADRSIPPVIGIDHILTRSAVATDVSRVRISGTDHLGLVATVVVPR